MPVNISINDDLELHTPSAEEKRWPWTDKWLDYQRDKLGLTEEQCKEIEKKANEKFAEMARENVSDYSDETKKRIHDDIEHIYLHNIVESVIKYTPQDIVNAHFESAVVSKSVAENKKYNQVMKNDVANDSKKPSELNSKVVKDVAFVSMSAADVSETVVEDELEEIKKRRKMAEENLASNQSSDQVSEPKVTISEKDKLVAEKSPNQATLPFGIGAIANDSVISDASEKAVPHKGNLTKHQAEELLGQFKNYGMSIGFTGGTRSKVRDLAENTTFLFDYKDKLVSHVNNGVVELTFNGNCTNRHYVELKNGCHVGVDYDSKTGAVKILKDVLFHKSGDRFDYVIDLKKTGGFFGKSDLEKVLGGKDAAEDVKKSLKDLKLIACSNPKIEGIDPESQPRRQTAAMVDGKSCGSQITTGQKIALALGVATVGVAAALTGVGVLFGGAAIAVGAGVAISNISGASVAAASGTVAASNIVASNTVFAVNQIASGTVHLVNHIGNIKPAFPAHDIAHVANNSVDKLASAFTNLGNDVASGFKGVGEKISSGSANLKGTDKVASAFTNLGNDIASGTTHVADKVAAGSKNVGEKIASVATNLGNDISNQMGNTFGQDSSGGSSSSANFASRVKDIANNPLTVPISIGVGGGIAAGVAASAAANHNANKGSRE